MVRGSSSLGEETMTTKRVGSILAPHIQRAPLPPCEGSYEEPALSSEELTLFLFLVAFGIVANGLLLLLQCGRSKLSTASFTYLRIVALFQLAFFFLPLPLHFLTRHSQRGVSWTSTNFLPVLLQLWHFTVISLIFCFAVRLQLLLNFVRRTRRWTSSGWIAWRKLFCILPLGTILNVSLTFEHRVSYSYCLSYAGKVMFGVSKRAELDGVQNLALSAIRMIPTFIYWLTILMTMSFILSEKFVLPKLGSPFANRHKALFSNLKPLVLGLIAAQSAVHLPSTYFFVTAREIDPDFQLQLYTVAYALPAPLLLLMSERLRSHLWLLVGRMVERKKEAVRKATASDGNNAPPNPCQLNYSKLEMENSEIEERSLSNHMVRALLRDDAVYRVRFAVHSTVPTVIEEEDESTMSFTRREDSETGLGLRDEGTIPEECQWTHTTFLNNREQMEKYGLTEAIDV
ncbi:hypothetical protein PMAYCL1PPCAC_16801 [Pristionchus mayeri]|uniref:G protein-coupled receptor n=1 Tax=Pristionchus mayeri TaxID=1317129 RepID=A0AAN5I074_9BILA|nr:hypothetical protein PMAYCL1PPCAC_16801 [Pristionchus mayeri]